MNSLLVLGEKCYSETPLEKVSVLFLPQNNVRVCMSERCNL